MLPSIDNAAFRRVLGHYPTGVCAITSVCDGKPAAMVVGSFSSVSLDPPLVGFFPDRSSTSWPKIRSSGCFCVNVLASDQQDVCKALASKSDDKFSAVGFQLSDRGTPVLDDVVAWIDCDLHAVTDAGDHYMVLGLVRRLEAGSRRDPLVFFQGGYGQFAPLDFQSA